MVLFDGCTSGKVAYEKGNYDESVLKAISRLRKSPNNKKASQTLMDSYPLTISWHQDNISRAMQSNDDFKWERVVTEYKQVNYLYNQLNRCPACLRLVNNPVHYVSELNDAREKAAAIRYQRGEELLARVRTTHNRNEAIEAFRHFEVACALMGEYKDARDKLAEAKFLATLKVVVEPIPAHRNLEISHEFFENKILEFVESMQVNEFVQFYSFTEARNIGLENPDQIIQLQFDDFVLGQVYLKEREVQQSKDSVVLAVIKAQRQVEHSDALVLNRPNDNVALLKYYRAEPIIASPVLKSDPYYNSGNNKKVTVCHKVPGSLGKSQTLSISQSALEHHLDHGDAQGSCNGETEPVKETEADNGSQSQPTQTITTTYNSTGATTNNAGSGSSNSSEKETSSVVQTSTEKTNADLSSIQNNAVQINSQEQTSADPEPTSRKVYGTVKATVHVFNKSLTSRGILDFKIIDAHNQRVLTQEKMPGEFVWYTEWGYFNGDERALDEYFLEIVKLKEAYPPPPQDLFVAFTQPIFGQVTSKIRDFYRGY
ncbi:MAG: hypothetical protein DHS20C17_10780 [Cyclobacteriaceae bacterium]|nr:MAG: hypothetical protein DHS20C17_10780 [Cyclobacteriaceae bacterium]